MRILQEFFIKKKEKLTFSGESKPPRGSHCNQGIRHQIPLRAWIPNALLSGTPTGSSVRVVFVVFNAERFRFGDQLFRLRHFFFLLFI